MSNRSKLAARIRSGQPILGIWMHIPHPIAAETLAQTGAYFLLVDGEHAPIPPDALGTILPCTERHGMPVLYRVAWNRIDLIKAALDHGATAIMVPMINAAAEAAAAVASAKYPPMGKRGMGAWRASNYYLEEADYAANANADTALVLQIETKEALQDLDAIAATPGIDALYIGPADLAMSLGIKPGELHPDLLAACQKVADAARRNGIAAGIDVASLSYVDTYRKMGFSLMTNGLDFGFILDGGRAVTDQFRGAVKD